MGGVCSVVLERKHMRYVDASSTDLRRPNDGETTKRTIYRWRDTSSGETYVVYDYDDGSPPPRFALESDPVVGYVNRDEAGQGYVFKFARGTDGPPKGVVVNSKGQFVLRGNRCQAMKMSGNIIGPLSKATAVLCPILAVAACLMHSAVAGSFVSALCLVCLLVLFFAVRPALEQYYATRTGEVGYSD